MIWFNNKYQKVKFIIELLTAVVLALCGIIYRSDIVDSSIASSYGHCIVLCVFWLICVVCIFVHPRFSDRASHIFGIINCFLCSVAVFFLMELITAVTKKEYSLSENIFGLTINYRENIWFSISIIFLTAGIISLITNNYRFGIEISAVIFIGFSIINYYVNDFRGSAITAADFAVIDTALDVAVEYTYTLTARVMTGLLGLFFIIIITGWNQKAWIFRKRYQYATGALSSCAVLIIVYSTFIFSDYTKEHYVHTISYFRTMNSYRLHGLLISFVRTIQDAIPEPPEGYTAELAREIASSYHSDQRISSNIPTEVQPNVIVIINECFSDLHVLGEFSSTEEEIPFFRNLDENCIKGYTFSSVLGGRTANSEFEFLTGHTMGFLSPSALPFQIYIRSPHHSLASILKQEEYAGVIAFHPSKGTNYRRNLTYPLLGFNEFYSKENAPIRLDKIRKSVSDESDYEALRFLFNKVRSASQKPVFLYNMTIQNHSPFGDDYKNFDTTIYAKGLSMEYPDVNQYLTLMNVSDKALGSLIEYLSKNDEPTILFFMGDHQPILNDGFYKDVFPSTLSSQEKDLLKYKIPFLIWANFDIEEKTIDLSSMNYMQMELINAYGGRKTGYMKFLEELHKEIPVINGFGYIGSDGKFYSFEDKESPYYSYIYDYSILQYNDLFDEKHRVEDFFEYAE